MNSKRPSKDMVQGTRRPAQFTINYSFWRLVLNRVCPACCTFVNAEMEPNGFIRGSAKVRIETVDIKVGSIASQIVKAKYLNSGIQVSSLFGVHTREVEKAICITAIELGGLRGSVMYNGCHLAKQPVTEANPPSIVSAGFVYMVRNSDLVKIGVTKNLLRRFGEIQPDEVLDTIRCSNYLEVEKELHLFFACKRIPQTEYFRLEGNEVEQAHRLLKKLAID